MLGTSLSYLIRLGCMILWFFFINSSEFILFISIHLLAHDSSGWQAILFIYLLNDFEKIQ